MTLSQLMQVDPKDALDAVTAVSTAAAAIFAAASAWASRTSASAAEASVEEARRARMEQMSPRLLFEKDFDEFSFRWPTPDFNLQQSVFLAVRGDGDQRRTPTFTLSNFGEKPALEVQIIFELDDGNEAFEIPEWYAEEGYRIEGEPEAAALRYPRSADVDTAIVLYRRWVEEVPFVAAGQPRKVTFPLNVLNRLFLRGLQNGHERFPPRDLKLLVTVKCHTVEGEPFETVFQFSAAPYAYRPERGYAVEVGGWFQELATLNRGTPEPVV